MINLRILLKTWKDAIFLLVMAIAWYLLACFVMADETTTDKQPQERNIQNGY